MRYKKITLCLSSFFISIFFVYRVLFFWPGTIEYYTSYLIYPVLVIQNNFVKPIKSYFQKKEHIDSLQQKIEDLQHERDILLAQNIELQGLITFAQDTQELIDFKARYDISDTILSQVLLKNFSEQSHFFLIDKGAHSGIEKDMVAVYKDCLIGRVIEVYPYYSKVLLISDRTCNVAAYCCQSKATGIFQGNNEAWSYSLNHISHLSQLEVGDLILSSGDGLIFPRGFGLGKIKSFTTQGLFHQTVVEPLVNLATIDHCYIVQKGAHNNLGQST